MPDLLEVKNIETYYDLVYAIRGASFAVEEGSITTILGNNGAGKSTILKTIMGQIKDQPDKGIIEYDGIPIQKWDTDKI
ncbi:MAG: ATP-binding cassette domain-containing protein, partial [Proteobacteria bacterium]|nr:ATP-binding cassette domain-containing protein [Pseudomonadota bacterium]